MKAGKQVFNFWLRSIEASSIASMLLLWLLWLLALPFYALAAIPFVLAGMVVAFLCVSIVRRLQLKNFWWSQLIPSVLIWPLVFPSLLGPSNDFWLGAHTLISVFGHLGGAMTWFLGVLKNHAQFEDLPTEFPKSSILLVPLLVFLLRDVVILFSTNFYARRV